MHHPVPVAAGSSLAAHPRRAPGGHRPRPGARVLLVALGLLLVLPVTGQAGSKPGAFWRSLLIPGWGQYQAGRKASGARFLAAELGLWSGYLGLRYLSSVRGETYRTWAAEHAGARTGGKSREYFDDLGYYRSRQEHDRRALYTDGPQAQLYPDGAGYFWEWDRDGSRQRYRELRNSSLSAERQALFATGLVLANHVLAAIHAARGESHGASMGAAPVLELLAASSLGRWGLELRRRF